MAAGRALPTCRRPRVAHPRTASRDSGRRGLPAAERRLSQPTARSTAPLLPADWWRGGPMGRRAASSRPWRHGGKMAAALRSLSRPSRPSPRSPRAPSAIRRPRGRSPPSFRSGGAAAIPPGEPFSLSPPADKMAAPARTGGGSAHAPRASAWRWGSTWGWGGTDKTGGRRKREGRGGGHRVKGAGMEGERGAGGAEGGWGVGGRRRWRGRQKERWVCGAQGVRGVRLWAVWVWGRWGLWVPEPEAVRCGGGQGGDGRGALLGRAPRRGGGGCAVRYGVGRWCCVGCRAGGCGQSRRARGPTGLPSYPQGRHCPHGSPFSLQLPSSPVVPPLPHRAPIHPSNRAALSVGSAPLPTPHTRGSISQQQRLLLCFILTPLLPRQL